MVEQVSVGRDSLNAERQQTRSSARVTAADEGDGRTSPDRPGPTADGQRAGKELQKALADELAGEPIDAPNEVRLRVEKDVDLVVAEVVNRETGEVVQEIPPEDMVEAARKLEAMLGRILDRDA